jgi:hypothetical protein
MAPIFNGFQPSKMAAHPCTARSMPKNIVFRHAASYDAAATTLATAQTI